MAASSEPLEALWASAPPPMLLLLPQERCEWCFRRRMKDVEQTNPLRCLSPASLGQGPLLNLRNKVDAG